MSATLTPVTPAERGRRLEALAIVASMAMVLSLLYVGEVAWKYFVRRTFVAASADVVWMAPLSALFFLVLLCAPVIFLAPVLPLRTSRHAALFASAGLTVFAALLPWTQVHRVAALVLAAGIGTWVARWLSNTPRLSALRRTGLALAGVHAVVAAVIVGSAMWTTRRAYAALPEPRAGAPNVLLIILDTVRANALSLYGYARRTSPELDQFAAYGTVFENAVATAPWTLPAHASMFTGEYPGLLSASFTKRLDEANPTLAEAFGAAGYETVGFTGNLHYTAWDSGLTRGFLHYTDFPRTVRQVLRSGWMGQTPTAVRLLHLTEKWQIRAAIADLKDLMVVPKPGGEELDARALADAVLDWEAARESEQPPRPYFAFVNFFGAHDSYAPPAALRTRFARDPTPRDLYDAEIVHIDQHLGRMLRELERRGTLANTVVVITADHGEQFGEHKLTGHGNSLYYQLLRVPLIVRGAGVAGGRRSAEVVSMRDLPATLLDLAAIRPARAFPGRSMAPLLSGDSSAAYEISPAISELTQDAPAPSDDPLHRSQGVSLVQDGRHFIRRNLRTPVEELYAIRSDPDEEINLARSDSGRDIVSERRSTLRRLMTAPQATSARASRTPARH